MADIIGDEPTKREIEIFNFCTNDECNYIYKFNLEELEVIKIEVVSARDKYCGSNFKDIYKYLVKGSEIENMISDYMKYPKEYGKYIKYIGSY